jgi:hypothetical protein
MRRLSLNSRLLLVPSATIISNSAHSHTLGNHTHTHTHLNCSICNRVFYGTENCFDLTANNSPSIRTSQLSACFRPAFIIAHESCCLAWTQSPIVLELCLSSSGAILPFNSKHFTTNHVPILVLTCACSSIGRGRLLPLVSAQFLAPFLDCLARPPCSASSL